MKRAWFVVFRVFRMFDRIVTLPIQYDPDAEIFFTSSRLCGWYLGCLGVYIFLFTAVYRLLCELYFPERNEFLGFDLRASFSYSLCLCVCAEIAVCIWTCQTKRDTIILILNKLLDTSKKHNSYYPGDRINFVWFTADTGAFVNTIAAIGFMTVPFLASVLPIVSQSDPASHMARLLIPYGSRVEQTILAAILQSSVCAFGAMPCIQILQMLTVWVVEFCGVMGEATTIHNPWVALQLQKLNAVHTHMMKWGNLKNKTASLSRKPGSIHGKNGSIRKLGGNINATVVPVSQIEGNSPEGLRTFMIERLAKMRKRNQIIMRWKSAVYKIVCFRPSLMLHRQIAILNSVVGDALHVYIPALILVGMCLIVCCIFFPIRFNPPWMVTAPCAVIAISVSSILAFLLPAAALVVKVSKRYHRFWKQRLRTALNRRQLRSCRNMAIGLGPFTYFQEGTLLLVLHIIFTYLGTLLINFKATN